ncbi:MAG TPA: sugar phosphate isomerase/epimerase family protein, partial [bacterium]|nr:sugar phosphate isomerase/epimerase family protein [bacterium]
MKLSSSSWSFHRTFGAGQMDQFSWLDFCAGKLRLDGVELLDFHFPNTEPSYLKDIKKYATDRGLTICCASVSNHFTGHYQDAQNDVEKVKKWIDIAQVLGAPVVRVFAGSGEEMSKQVIYDQAVECLQKVAMYAEHVGVVLGLENHGGTTAEQVLALLRDVQSPWLKLTLDTGNFPPSETYKSIEACLPHAVIVHAKLYEL